MIWTKMHNFLLISAVAYVFWLMIPSCLGYANSVFPFLLVFFINWYLEMVTKIRGQLHKIMKAYPKPWPIFEIMLLIQTYDSIRDNVTRFGRLFGPWIIIDMGHTIMRIVFSAFIVSSDSLSSVATLRNMSLVLLYSCLLYMVCRKGTALEEESSDFLELLGKELVSYKHYDKGIWTRNDQSVSSCLERMKAIQIQTSYGILNLGLIPSVCACFPVNGTF